MARAEEERLAYARGYNAGSRNRWPAFAPPAPPDDVVRGLQSALIALRDRFDYWCSQFDEDDELVLDLKPYAHDADRSLAAITEWIRSHAEGGPR